MRVYNVSAKSPGQFSIYQISEFDTLSVTLINSFSELVSREMLAANLLFTFSVSLAVSGVYV